MLSVFSLQYHKSKETCLNVRYYIFANIFGFKWAYHQVTLRTHGPRLPIKWFR